MKNRAKCKLCLSIVESYHPTDYVECKCGQIAVDGGLAMHCYAIDFNNFLRVDEEGNEIIVTVKDQELFDEEKKIFNNDIELSKKHSKAFMLENLDYFINSIERLPSHAMEMPIDHSDLLSVLKLISALFKAGD